MLISSYRFLSFILILPLVTACSSESFDETRFQIAQSNEGSSESSSISLNGAATSCNKLRYYSYRLGTGTKNLPMRLTCGQDKVIFHRAFPGLRGYAAARAILKIRNRNTNQIYFWNAGVQVGSGADRVAYRLGDDVCPNLTVSKTHLGYGWFDGAQNSQVKVMAKQGSSPCVNSQIEILPDSYLSVWVEDESPNCQKQDLKLISRLKMFEPNFQEWQIPTRMTEIFNTQMSMPPNRSGVWAISAVEGSVVKNPNLVCGRERYSLITQRTVNGGIIGTTERVMPASQGQGHLMMGSSETFSLSPGNYTFGLSIGANLYSSPVLTGSSGTGDAMLLLIRY